MEGLLGWGVGALRRGDSFGFSLIGRKSTSGIGFLPGASGGGSGTGAADVFVTLVRAVEDFRVMPWRTLWETPSRHALRDSTTETDGRRTERRLSTCGHGTASRSVSGRGREQGVAHQSRPAPRRFYLGNARTQIYDWFPRPLVEMGAHLTFCLKKCGLR